MAKFWPAFYYCIPIHMKVITVDEKDYDFISALAEVTGMTEAEILQCVVLLCIQHCQTLKEYPNQKVIPLPDNLVNTRTWVNLHKVKDLAGI